MTRNTRRTARLVSAAVCLAALCTGTAAVAPAAEIVVTTSDEQTHHDTARFVVTKLETVEPVAAEQLGELTLNNPEYLTATPGVPTGEPVIVTADSTGTARITGLEPGVYQIVEQTQRRGNEAEVLASPWLVSITDSNSTIMTRTKAQPLVVTKTARDAAVPAGGSAEYAIGVNVPEPDLDGKLHQLDIVDELDRRLEFGRLISAEVANLSGEKPLQENRDYTLTWQNTTFTFSLTETGLDTVADLRAGHPETRVVIRFSAGLRTPSSTSEMVPNVAGYAPDGHCFDCDDPGRRDAVLSTEAMVLFSGTGAPPAERPDRLSSAPWWALLLFPWLAPGDLGSSSGGSSSPAAPGPAEGEAGTPPEGQAPEGAPEAQAAPPDGNPAADDSTGTQAVTGALASTGASVLGLIAAGITLIVLGWVLTKRRREVDTEVGET